MEDVLKTNSQQVPIPNSTAVLVLGILSIVTCMCYGIVGIILAIVALVLHSKGIKSYRIAPENYTASSFSNMKAGKVCAIIGLILSILMLVYMIVIIAVIGFEAIKSGNPQDIIDRLEDLQ